MKKSMRLSKGSWRFACTPELFTQKKIFMSIKFLGNVCKLKQIFHLINLSIVKHSPKFLTGLWMLIFSIIIFFSCKKQLSCAGCADGNNKTPVAIAGRDTIIALPLNSVVLDGSASYDPDGSITEFSWSKISGPANFNLVNASAAKTVVKSLVAGTYLFELKATDNGGLSATDTLMITVDAVPASNHTPAANAGRDTTITLPLNIIFLDGSASADPDNNISNYLWTKISGPSLFTIVDANAAQTHVTNLTQGDYLFELKVTDAGSLASRDTVRISVLIAGTTEIIFTDLRWINQCYDPRPGVCWINGDAPSYGFYIKDTANILPDSAKAILGVWVKMDTSSVWEQTPNNCWNFPDPYPQTKFTYCRTSEGMSIYSWFPWENPEGRKAELKIRF